MAFSNGSDAHAALFSATDSFIVVLWSDSRSRRSRLGGDRTVEKMSDKMWEYEQKEKEKR